MYHAQPPIIDWIAYLERQQSLLSFAAFTRPYGILLQEATGFGFVHQLYTFRDGTGCFYRSTEETQVADAYYLQLIRNRDPRLTEWQQHGLQENVRADALIAECKNAAWSADDAVHQYDRVLKQCETTMLYGTVIPYRILSAINTAIEQGTDIQDFAEVLALFEPLRATAKYPEFAQHIFPLFWRAAATLTEQNAAFFSLLDPDELRQVLRQPATFRAADVVSRQRGCVFWFDTAAQRTFFSIDPAAIAAFTTDKGSTTTTQLYGRTANPGVVRGKARIVNTTVDAVNFQEGDIIISINTNPALMPWLTKCGGIVTDEGGIMCHAAIVSRELNKPCVIGTKQATKVIRDGDIVEVNADAQTVTILQRS